VTDTSSRRAEAVRRLVLLYETWAEVSGSDANSAAGVPVRGQLARWTAQWERLRAEDAERRR
jgi:hypothetical protein